MKRSRRIWDELLAVIEEALAAFSGVSPDMIAHSPAHPIARGASKPCSSMRPSSVCTKPRPNELYKGR